MSFKNLFDRIAIGWKIAWIVLYMAILLLGLLLPNSQITTFVKLAGIVICFFYTAIYFPHDYYLLLAMGATCIADLILAGNNISPLGVAVFVSAQVFHLLHLLVLAKYPYKKYLIFYGVIAITLLVTDFILDFAPLLYVAVFLYAILLIINIMISQHWHRHNPKSKPAQFAAIGFILFGCCDFCTAISYLALIGLIPTVFYALANFFVWLFYYPSQIALSNTGKYAIMNTKEGKS